ncbi:unnamed protein product [Kuraishia capsulata CBS 1993]|uniref:D-xylose 1-dehydrogenase (NADP(+), D-xylono-1,5-lactone-forming) n=1 Tax=Kuraishia capsulata CBS 1993 TaxID=1382522 RepID=W6MHJ8_9ASCO|nr:uncharacterized protein KUCA_T00001436001 [Kuraishia capsulata CBS 1993]CDK25466.1 unnamed protein product [Kuraishia capsulata CBS 1993]
MPLDFPVEYFNPTSVIVFLSFFAMSQLPTLKWGIISTGMISSWFTTDISIDRPDARANHVIAAIGSSSPEKGLAFVEKYLPHINTPLIQTYDEVYSNDDVECIYIGLPHSMHHEHVLKALNAGKNVLCEKAFCMNAREAREMFALAEKKGLFLMEAMWTRFFPVIHEIRDLLFEQKALGEIRRLIMDMSFDAKLEALSDDDRMKNPRLGAGSVLDLGVYVLTYSRLLLDSGVGNKAAKFTSTAAMKIRGGVDLLTSILVQYEETGRQAVLTCGLEVAGSQPYLRLSGTKGYIELWGFNQASPRRYRITYTDGKVVEKKFDIPGYGLYYEADAVAIDIKQGKTQNNLCPPAESLLVMDTIDSLRKQNNLVYPDFD